MAIPDRGRGERVNVGVVVFQPDNHVDVRIAEIGKLRALTGATWDSYAGDMRLRLLMRLGNSNNALEELKASPRFDPYFESSSPGWFSAGALDEYQASVRELLDTLVYKPKTVEIRQKTTRINTEIARVFKRSDVLARKDEPIEDHRVHRDVFIEDDLQADFVQKNGVYRAVTTLELRRAHIDVREAAIKALTLDRARAKLGKKTIRICVYASNDPDEKEARSSIGMVSNYAHHTFNWENPDQRKRFINSIYSAMGKEGALL